MLLFYKPLLLEFIKKLFHRTEHGTVAEVLVESKTVIQSYLIGLLIETAIVAALNAIGLLILGVDYAILLGFIGALLNIIPYVGGLIALSLAVVMALVTKPPTYALLVMAMFLLIQLIDNNFLVPKIVASKVRLNALVSLIAVLCGGALWGIPGMFLSIPLLAIIKVIFDRIEPLKPWGFVLGDTMPPIGKIIFRFPVVGALKKVK
jgi:predicted PurR-regulated permease PerM